MTRALSLLTLSAALLLPGVAAAGPSPCASQSGEATRAGAVACAEQAPAASAGTAEATQQPSGLLGLGCRRWSIGAMAVGMRDAPVGFEHGPAAARACSVRELYAGHRPQPGHAPAA